MAFSIMNDGPELLRVSREELEPFMTRALQKRRERFGNEILFYSPTSYPYRVNEHAVLNPYRFVSLSVTGGACSLRCEHCMGRYLDGMQPATTPEEVIRRAQLAKANGGTGLLISGGSDSQGRVPLKQFGEAIRMIKTQLEMQVVVHTGLLDETTADILQKAHIDAAMLDVIGDDRTAREVYHLNNGTERTRQSLRFLQERHIPFVPHVLVGLNRGRIVGELSALDMIAGRRPAAVVIIVLNPLPHTPMSDVKPPSPETVGRIITIARLGLETAPLLLGCARPMGTHKVETDRIAILGGVNGIAYVSQEGVELAEELGLRPKFIDECCSLAHLHLVASNEL